MNKLDNLPEITDHVLHELTADESLKFRIMQTAAQGSVKKTGRSSFHPVPILCSVIAVLLLTVFALNGMKPVDPYKPGNLNVFAAGSLTTEEPVTLVSPFAGIDASSVRSVLWTGHGSVTSAEDCFSLVNTLQKSTGANEPSAVETENRIIITMNDGTSYSFEEKEPFLISGQAWECSAFFHDFHMMTE